MWFASRSGRSLTPIPPILSPEYRGEGANQIGGINPALLRVSRRAGFIPPLAHAGRPLLAVFSLLLIASLSLTGCSTTSSIQPSQLRPIEERPAEMQKVFAPPMVEVPQQTPNWCWAACFQTILLSSGVPTTQRTIVKDVMGSVVNEKVTVEQLMHAFNSRGVSVTYIPGKPSRDLLISFLNGDKPSMRHLIVQRRENGTIDWHAVVIWGYEIPADGRLYVYMYDPESNREYKDWYAYDDHWQASFFVTVNRMEAFDQWLGKPPVTTR